MFPRKALCMVILSILNENTEGLTGYAIVKAIKNKFGSTRALSPGTIYPRLRKLRRHGDIFEEGNLYVISEQGKSKLTATIPEIMEKSFEFMPRLFHTLRHPFGFRDFARLHWRTPKLQKYKEWLESELATVNRLLEEREKTVKIEIQDDWEE